MANDIRIPVVAFQFEPPMVGRQPCVDDGHDRNAAASQIECTWCLLAAMACVAFDSNRKQPLLIHPITAGRRPILATEGKATIMKGKRRESAPSMNPNPNPNRSALARTWLTGAVAACLFGLLTGGCAGTPTHPRDTALPTGRWTGDGVCLFAAADGCDLVAGCGHGQFPPPAVHGDGTFEVMGTYRVEVGPISTNPAPPAVFSGVLRGQTLTLSVVPSDPSLRSASYVLQPTNGSGKCSVPCV